MGNIYLSSSKLQYLWEWSVFPAFQPEAGISVGNVFAVLFAVGFLYALAALQSAWQQSVRYDRLKREGGDDELRDDFRR